MEGDRSGAFPSSADPQFPSRRYSTTARRRGKAPREDRGREAWEGRERGFRSSGGRIREGRGERESAVQSPRGSGKPWAPILSRNLSLTAAADGRRTNECTRRNRPRKAPAETRSKMLSKDVPKAWESMIYFAQK